MLLSPGTILDQYYIIHLINEGGMGIVYLAYDLKSKRHVALKVMRHAFHGPSHAEMVRHFQREIEMISRLQHLRIVPVYASGQAKVPGASSILYFVMRYIQAATLAECLPTGPDPLPLPTGVRLLGQLGEALDYAHAQRIVHRDIKPSNVLLDGDGNAYLADFGLAKPIEAQASHGSSRLPGTPDYTAPEVHMGEPATIRSDIYSLGVMAFQMITGRLPFSAHGTASVGLLHIQNPVPALRSLVATVPIEVEREILKALSKDPQARHESAGELTNALAGIVGPESPAQAAELRSTIQAHANRQIPEPINPSIQARYARAIWGTRLKRSALTIVLAIALGVAASLGYWAWQRGNELEQQLRTNADRFQRTVAALYTGVAAVNTSAAQGTNVAPTLTAVQAQLVAVLTQGATNAVPTINALQSQVATLSTVNPVATQTATGTPTPTPISTITPTPRIVRSSSPTANPSVSATSRPGQATETDEPASTPSPSKSATRPVTRTPSITPSLPPTLPPTIVTVPTTSGPSPATTEAPTPGVTVDPPPATTEAPVSVATDTPFPVTTPAPRVGPTNTPPSPTTQAPSKTPTPPAVSVPPTATKTPVPPPPVPSVIVSRTVPPLPTLRATLEPTRPPTRTPPLATRTPRVPTHTPLATIRAARATPTPTPTETPAPR